MAKSKENLIVPNSSRGFTLIELLIVIAIIAILVVIVIIAINPAARINDSKDRQAASNVRSAGTLLSTCATHQITVSAGIYEPCGPSPASTTPTATLNTYGTAPANVKLYQGAAAGQNDLCAAQQGSAANYFVWRLNGTAAISGTTIAPGTTTQIVGTLSAVADATVCP